MIFRFLVILGVNLENRPGLRGAVNNFLANRFSRSTRILKGLKKPFPNPGRSSKSADGVKSYSPSKFRKKIHPPRWSKSYHHRFGPNFRPQRKRVLEHSGKPKRPQMGSYDLFSPRGPLRTRFWAQTLVLKILPDFPMKKIKKYWEPLTWGLKTHFLTFPSNP